VRRALAERLGNVGSAEAVEVLRQILYGKDRYDVLHAAAEALGNVGRAEAVEVLGQALYHGDPHVRMCAAWGVEECRRR
jgi:HEAT repeat protein